MKKRNQLLALCALVILVLTVFACENPFIPGKYKEPAPPQAPSISIEASPIGPYIKGEGLTITATAKVGDGGDLSYQWYSNTKNSNSGGKKISGATGESYRPSTDIEEAIDTAYYYVEVTNTLYGRTTTASSRTIDVTVYDVGTDTPLREVNVTVITPVKGAEPSEVVATEAGYTLVEMEWDPWPRVFQERYQYTVKVKIQAENGYTLIALRSAKINGHAATINRINGNTVELSYKFLEMKGVDAMEVKTQPSNMTYVHGNALDLSGLVVTVTYSDGTTEDVTAAEFADRDITTNPAHDSAVSHTNNDGRPIVVSHAGVTAETGNLNVSKAIITAPDVFVVGPLRGETPHTTTSVDSAENYTASAVSWSVGNTPFTGSTFEGSTQYTATVMLTVKSGDFVFASGGDLSAKISGLAATAVSDNTGTSVTVSYQFAATSDKVITGIEVTNQPSTLTYTHGGTLNLNGLEVTVEYEGDPNPEVVLFAQFASKNISTYPANGETLIRTARNGMPVEVRIGSLYANTNQLVVNPKELTITGVSHSKTYDGNTTVTDGVTGVTFTGTIGDDNAHVFVTLSTVNAVYENADVGSTMRINGLTLEGDAAGNYRVTTPVTGVTATPGITKINPTVTTWPIASVTAGQALSAAQISTNFSGYSTPTGLNGAAVTGGYTFNNQGTTVALASSGNSYAATFTPDSANYNSVTGDIVVTVRSTSTSTAAMEMSRIPAGSYSRDQYVGVYLQTFTKTITTAFYIGKYEVTQGQYNTVMTGNTDSLSVNPSNFTTGADAGETQNRRPVENVTWFDAVYFCNRLSTLEGLQPVYTISITTKSGTAPNQYITAATVTQNMNNNGYRLPTEMEWELACNNPAGFRANSQNAWYDSLNKTHEVGKKLPNRYGLYDMVGNVRELVWDGYDSYNSYNQTDGLGPTGWATRRVQKGGCYSDSYDSDLRVNMLSAFRALDKTNNNSQDITYNRLGVDSRSQSTGFRVARR